MCCDILTPNRHTLKLALSFAKFYVTTMKSPEMAYRYVKEALTTERGKDF